VKWPRRSATRTAVGTLEAATPADAWLEEGRRQFAARPVTLTPDVALALPRLQQAIEAALVLDDVAADVEVVCRWQRLAGNASRVFLAYIPAGS
jgi:hypothetical protein